MNMGFLLDIILGSSHGSRIPLGAMPLADSPDTFKLALEQGMALESIYSLLDVPSYQNLVPFGELAKLKRIKSPLYLGYLIDLSPYGNIDDYLKIHFPTTKRMFRRQADKLRKEVDPLHKIFHGSVLEEHDLELLFDGLEGFLERRFEQMEAHNYELPFLPQYKKMFRFLVPKGEAVIFSLFHQGKPISIGIGFVQGQTLYLFNIAFDVDYGPYGLGNQMLLDVLEWCFERGIRIVDMGRGDYFHKRKWVNSSYIYEEITLFRPYNIGTSLKAYGSWARNCLRYHLIGLLKKWGLQAWARSFFKWKYRHLGPHTKPRDTQVDND